MLRHAVSGYQFFDTERPCKAVDKYENAITKRPLDVFNLNDRRKILVMRDPRSIITSKHWSNPNKYFCGANLAKEVHPGVIPTWEAFKSQDGFVVKYEELVRNPETIQAALGETFDFDYCGNFSEFYKSEIPIGLRRALNGVRTLDNGHDWREHLPRIKAQFDAYPELHDVLIEMGYEQNRDWFLEI